MTMAPRIAFVTVNVSTTFQTLMENIYPQSSKLHTQNQNLLGPCLLSLPLSPFFSLSLSLIHTSKTPTSHPHEHHISTFKNPRNTSQAPHQDMDWFSWLSKGSLDPSLIYEYGRAFALNELEEEDISYFDHEFLQSMGISVAKHRLEILKLAKKEHGGPRPISGLITAFNRTKRSVGKYISKLVFHGQEPDVKASPEPNRYKEQWRGALSSRKHNSEKEMKEKTIVYQDRRNLTLSGPLVDGRVQDKYLLAHKTQKFSGPLDTRTHQKPAMALPRCPSPKFLSGPLDRRVLEKTLYPMKSPKFSGPLDGRVQERFTVPRSPKLSSPLERTAKSPRLLWNDFNKVNMDAYEYDEHSLWTKLFDDMKPT